MTVPPATERLIFREWALDDLDAFQLICSDSRIMQYVGNGQPWTRQTSRQFIERAIAMSASTGFCQWPLIHADDSTLIGFCGIVNSDDGAEIGWRVAHDYWGQGLATEAARTVLRFSFVTLGFQRIIATVQAANLASIRVAEKLGMRMEKRVDHNGREVIVFAMRNQGESFVD